MEDFIKMAEFVSKKNYFEFNAKVKQQLSATAIGTKFAPPYACIFMDKLKLNFLIHKYTSCWYSSSTETMSFLFGFMVKKSLGYF